MKIIKVFLLSSIFLPLLFLFFFPREVHSQYYCPGACSSQLRVDLFECLTLSGNTCKFQVKPGYEDAKVNCTGDGTDCRTVTKICVSSSSCTYSASQGKCVCGVKYSACCSGSGSCTCGGWANASCGGGTCLPTERRQNRTCTPAGCDVQSRCVSDPACEIPPPAPPTCSVTPLDGTSFNVGSSGRFRTTPAGEYTRSEIWSSPTGSMDWDNLYQGGTGGTGTFTCPSVGTFYIVCNAINESHPIQPRCSGNPWCEWSPNPPSTLTCGSNVSDDGLEGWSDCTGSDVQTVTCSSPPSGSCGVPRPAMIVNSCDDGTNSGSLSMSWSDVENASTYRRQLDNNSDFSSPIVNNTGASPLTRSGLSAGTYYGRVRVETGSCSPTPGAYSSTRSVTIPSCGGGEVCNGCNPSPGGCGAGSCASNQRLYTEVCDPPDASICPTHGDTSCVPDPTCVPPDCAVPNQPTVTSSCDSGGDVTILCDWNSISGATYRVQITRDGSVVRDTTTSSSSYTLYNQPPGHTYACRVRVQTSSTGCATPGDYSSYGSENVSSGKCRSCTITLPSGDITLYPGNTKPLSPTIGGDSSWVDRLSFSLNTSAYASLCSFSLTECPAGNSSYTVDTDDSTRANITGYAAGTSTLTVGGVMNDVPNPGDTTNCTPVTRTVEVENPPAWWQVRGGDVVTTGSIQSKVEGCFFSSCLDYLDVAGNSGFSSNFDPGVPIYKTSIVPSAADISVTGWNADSPFAGYNTKKEILYSLGYFKQKAGVTDDNELEATSIDYANVSKLTEGGADANGYHYVSVSGGFSFDGALPLNIGTNKVVLFVDGNLDINAPIRVADGVGFFMAIVGGNIVVNPSLGQSPQDVSSFGPSPLREPDLEGLYFTEGQFITGDGDQQLYVRGSIAALGNAVGSPASFPDKGILFQRYLVNNAAHPAEYFEYAPDLLFNFPPSMGEQTIRWEEAAP